MSAKLVTHLKDSLATEVLRLEKLPLEVGDWGSGLSRLEHSSQMELTQVRERLGNR